MGFPVILTPQSQDDLAHIFPCMIRRSFMCFGSVTPPEEQRSLLAPAIEVLDNR
jgi:hypothetical protein